MARQWVLKLERGTANPTLASLWRALDVLGLALNVGPAGEHPGRPDPIDLDFLLGTFVEGPR